jgi:outer membrane protein assembly factor BamD (BamD/ComL family)
MLRGMLHRLIVSVGLLAGLIHLVSCSGSDVPTLAGETQVATAEADVLYQKGKQADDAGKTGRAIKYYEKTAKRYPSAPVAPQARFRQAQLLEQEGDVEKAFKAYDQFLTHFQGSGLYATALSRQTAMAQAAAEGDVKSSFLGLKTKLSVDKTVDMLSKVRGYAPESKAAAKAQFTIGELYQSKHKSKEAIEAYQLLVSDQPDSPLAPEALFRVGLLYMDQADRGNQNQANLDLAREAFNDYLIQYPGHSRNAEARKMISHLGGRDQQRSFDIAEFYEKTDKPEAAKVYYRDVVKSTKSGPLHDAAKARLAALGE